MTDADETILVGEGEETGAAPTPTSSEAERRQGRMNWDILFARPARLMGYEEGGEVEDEEEQRRRGEVW